MTMNAMLKTIRKEIEKWLGEEKKFNCLNTDVLFIFMSEIYDYELEIEEFTLSSITIKDNKVTTRFELLDQDNSKHKLILHWKEA